MKHILVERATEHPAFWLQWWATWGLGGSVWAGWDLDTVIQVGTVVLITLNCGVAGIKLLDWRDERKAKKQSRKRPFRTNRS